MNSRVHEEIDIGGYRVVGEVYARSSDRVQEQQQDYCSGYDYRGTCRRLFRAGPVRSEVWRPGSQPKSLLHILTACLVSWLAFYLLLLK